MVRSSEIGGLWWSPQGLWMHWDQPDCKDCEQSGGTCGLDDTGEDSYVVACQYKDLRMSKKDTYGLIIGIGLPVLVFISGATWYVLRRRSSPPLRHRFGPPAVQTVAPSPQLPVLQGAGLDPEIIDKYPTTLLSDTKRLLGHNDTTCPICLSEYKAKETLRTIPDCGHYFHMECIDMWLKSKGTCPLCRNSLKKLESESTESGTSTPRSWDGLPPPSLSRVVLH